MNKKILLSIALILFILLFSISKNNKNIVMAQAAPPSIDCKWVSGGCDTNTLGGTHCAKYGSAQDCRCNNDWDIAAVQCPNGYKLIGGGCRCNNGGGYNGDSCPTNDISNAMTTTTCTDYNNPNAGYDWWFCDFDAASVNETAYAMCCKFS
jgi:hypothetical protein